MKSGIAPRTLVAQVEGTAGWLHASSRVRPSADPHAEPRAAHVVEALGRIDEAERDQAEGGPGYLRLLLAAHFATVATFVPTDVDVRIRHHVWASLEDPSGLEARVAVVDEIASWDARLVSERTVQGSDGKSLSGHDGEWLSVRAGALGRALVLGATAIAEHLAAAIDRELDREQKTLADALARKAPAREALSIATVLAHNLGDLSRVVEQWPNRPELAEHRARYTRLGHESGRFATAGAMNKALMALENHRFLALRKPRALRTARALLLPIGPWFDAWGETIATHEALEPRDRAEVVAALLEIHASSPDQLGCLRAIAGIHRATRGGIELYVDDLPARLRKDALRGRVREALDVSQAHFEARIQKRFESLNLRSG
ncbi:MAG: hypothetical protein JST00_42940 [Deltaproteobacteria bacterium]|nr:hypothetical protein [Deltaproteobacteria bacterium]